MNDLIGGHVSLMFNSASPVRVAVAAGQVRLIAIGAPQRSATLPDVPTIRESGLPDFEATTWIGLYGPAKLPAALARRISERVAGILQQPEMRERLAGMGTEARSGTPEELRDILARDIARWGKLVREGNIRSE
jgi:tripartite-type tricarboxylate transporter receptor subunit TctC